LFVQLIRQGIVETLKISLNERAIDGGRVVQTVQRSRIKVANSDNNQTGQRREWTLEDILDFIGAGADCLGTRRVRNAVGKEKNNAELVNVGTVRRSSCNARGSNEQGVLRRRRTSIVVVVLNGIDDIRAIAIGRCFADVVEQTDVTATIGTTERKGS
jgi:hypothetical protein